MRNMVEVYSYYENIAEVSVKWVSSRQNDCGELNQMIS